MVVLEKEAGIAIAAAIAMAGSAMATAWAQATIGASIMGVLAERPEDTFKLIVYMALPELLAILGFGLAIMLMGKMEVKPGA